MIRQDTNKCGVTKQDTIGDSGSAARFFYCAKASKKERGKENTHPTVKPLALMQYLCKLVTSPDGIILDPFTGSGTTLLAANKERFNFIGIEKEPEYVEICRKRIQDVISDKNKDNEEDQNSTSNIFFK